MSAALLPTYDRAPVRLVSGSGCTVVDDAGRAYLDCLGGIAVCALGHAHPAIADAVADQARRLVHVSNLYHHEPAETLARELVERSGLRGAFFCNSGTEANEAAIKLARKLASRRGETDRLTIVACTGAFHGRTLGALAGTWNAAYREGFGPLPGGFEFAPFNDVEALDAAIDQRTAAFIVEPVQGESGVRVASAAFLNAARELCTRRGALLIFDEVQCGMGRLGTLFAFQSFGVVPDVITMAKALANGLPIGAMLAGERAATGLQAGDHGSTFGGSPIPCAAALAHLRVRDAENLDAAVRERSADIFDRLTTLALRHDHAIAPPRGVGLMIGLPVHQPLEARAVAAAARERGLLVGTAGDNVLRITPPLTISAREVARAAELLDEALDSVQ